MCMLANSSSSSRSHFPWDQMELQGGEMSQAWTPNRSLKARQFRGDPAA